MYICVIYIYVCNVCYMCVCIYIYIYICTTHHLDGSADVADSERGDPAKDLGRQIRIMRLASAT